MHPAAGEPPQQEAIHGAEGKPALLRRRTRALHVVEQPRDLGGRKIGIEHEPGARRDQRLMSALPQRGAGIRRAAILPNDGIVDGAAGGPLPHNRGLALVGDAEGRDIAGVSPRPRNGCAHRCKRRRPDILGIMLDQAGRRIDLGKFLLRTRDRRQRDIEQDSPRRGRALVDREKIIGQARSFALPRPRTATLARRRSIHVSYRRPKATASVIGRHRPWRP